MGAQSARERGAPSTPHSHTLGPRTPPRPPACSKHGELESAAGGRDGQRRDGAERERDAERDIRANERDCNGDGDDTDSDSDDRNDAPTTQQTTASDGDNIDERADCDHERDDGDTCDHDTRDTCERDNDSNDSSQGTGSGDNSDGYSSDGDTIGRNLDPAV